MSGEIISRDSSFSESERVLIATIADAAIPSNSEPEMPGGGDPSILPLILRKAEPFQARIKTALEILAGELAVGAVEADVLIHLLDSDARLRGAYRMLTIAIVQAYYQDARVLKALELEARPPFPQGHTVADGDWSLLLPVKQRGTLYRQI